MSHAYTLINSATLQIVRMGWCTDPADVQAQAAAQPGHEILDGAFDSVSYQVTRQPGGKLQAVKRSDAEIAAYHKAKADHLEAAEINADLPSRGMQEILKAKGMEVTPADLAAARAQLKAKRAAKGVV